PQPARPEPAGPQPGRTQPGSRELAPGPAATGARRARRRSPNTLLGDWLLRFGHAARRWPWWTQVGLIYAGARLVSWAIMAGVALHQGPNPWGPAAPDYQHFINFWDSSWYREVFTSGYPGTVPRNPAGTALENPWAFYPLYPVLVRALASVTALNWLVLAPAVSVLCGLAATLVVYRLFRRFATTTTALWGVVFFVTFPVSPVLQIPYAESLSLLLLAAALLLLVRGQYLWAAPVVALMCLSRPVGLPFAALVGAHLLLRLWQGWRGTRVVRRQELLRLGTLQLVSAVGAVAWPLIAWAATGDMKAYTDTETAWRGGELVLFKPWVTAGKQLLGPVLGPAAPVLLVVLAALYLNSRAVRQLGTGMRLWCVAYFLYLLAFLQPQTSTFRMLLPLFPLALAGACLSRSRAFRVTVVVMFVLLQLVWVTWLWAWAPLPGGGDYPP
ncbi:MAG: hypothetical protein ACHP7K_03365, partial [Actinomycetales bacterium]